MVLVDAQGKPVQASTDENPYASKDMDMALSHVVEECGEVIAAYGKCRRFGPLSVNPELPVEEQEMNGDWLLREIKDLQRAISVFGKFLNA